MREVNLKRTLCLPPKSDRKGDGGLRTKGYLKKSLPDKPLITVITVVFNGVDKLEDTIKSVISQAYDNVEYIIIDGGSTDGTLDIIRKYEGQIDYWVSEKDEGIYDAMNKAITLASGEWIYFLNSGDAFIEENILSHIRSYLNQSSYSVVAGKVAVVRNNKIIDEFPYPIKGLRSVKSMFESHFCHQALFIKTKAYLTAACFDKSYKIFSDFNTVYRIIDCEKSYNNTNICIAKFDSQGLSSNPKYSVLMYKEKTKIYSNFGENMKYYKYYLGLARAFLYRIKTFFF